MRGPVERICMLMSGLKGLMDWCRGVGDSWAGGGYLKAMTVCLLVIGGSVDGLRRLQQTHLIIYM